jgi:hypothetical protein
MTTHFGRTTPFQGYVLGIGGIVCGVPDDLVRDEDRLIHMRQCRQLLCKQTERDFGYSIAKWHEFLKNSEQFRDEYTFHYAWDAVEPEVERLIRDPERTRLVHLLECREEPQSDQKAEG